MVECDTVRGYRGDSEKRAGALSPDSRERLSRLVVLHRHGAGDAGMGHTERRDAGALRRGDGGAVVVLLLSWCCCCYGVPRIIRKPWRRMNNSGTESSTKEKFHNVH